MKAWCGSFVLLITSLWVFNATSLMAADLPDAEWQEMTNCYFAPVPENFLDVSTEEQESWTQGLTQFLVGESVGITIKESLKYLGAAIAGTIANVISAIIWSIPTVGNVGTSSDLILMSDGEVVGSEIIAHKEYAAIYVSMWADLSSTFVVEKLEIDGSTWTEYKSYQLLTNTEIANLGTSVTYSQIYTPKSPFTLSESGTYRVDDTVFEVIPDTESPLVVSHSFETSPDGNIQVIFDEELEGATLSNTNFNVVGSSSGTHVCSFDFNTLSYTLKIDPETDFSFEEEVSVTVTTGVADIAGNHLQLSYSFGFQVTGAPSYFISSWSGQNGNITPSGTNVHLLGETVSFSANPNSGFEVERWYLDGSPMLEEVTEYIIESIEASHSITVTFKEIDPETVELAVPNGGERWFSGRSAYITWEWEGNIGDNVNLELVQNNSFSSLIINETPNDGAYRWNIPIGVSEGSDYAVKVSTIDGTTNDYSDAFFTIEPPLDVEFIEIRTAAELQNISTDGAYPRQGHYLLMNDIDVAGSGIANFRPIGSDYQHYFRGSFDGQGYTISGLDIDRPTESYIGLFSVLMENGVIKNLNIAVDGINGFSSVGALVGECAGTIVNCHVVAINDYLDGKGGDMIGGLVGENTGTGHISNCSVDTRPDEIEAEGSTDGIGGIAGSNSGRIEWCWTNGTIDAWSSSNGKYGDGIGGIVGVNYGTISESYSECQWVQGQHWTGGIAGIQAAGSIVDCYFSGAQLDSDIGGGGIAGKADGGNIDRCYVTGCVDANTEEGALVGRHYATISNSFWCTCIDQAKGIGIGSVINSRNICDSVSIMNPYVNAGWDFDNVWAINIGNSPPELRGIGSMLDPPIGFVASTDQSNGVYLSWNPIQYSVASNSYNAVYRVFRSNSTDVNAEKVEVTTSWQANPEFVDTTAVPQGDYYYCIKSAATIHGSRESAFSEFVLGKRAYPPVNSPNGVIASDGIPNTSLIEWNHVSNATYYRVFRSELTDESNISIGDWQTNMTFGDTSSLSGVEYTYSVVAAVDETGKGISDYSVKDIGSRISIDESAPVISVTMIPQTPTEMQNITVDIYAEDDSFIESVTLYWNDGTDHQQYWGNLGTPSWSLSYSIGAFDQGDTLLYWAKATDSSGNIAFSEYKNIIVSEEKIFAPIRPVGLTETYSYSPTSYLTGAAGSNIGTNIEYGFDWGDGSSVTWGDSLQNHSWDSQGQYVIKAIVRSVKDTSMMTKWSGGLIVSVNVTVTENNETDIIEFSFLEQIEAALINAVNNTVDIIVAFGTDLTSLVSTFTLSDGATAQVEGVDQMTGISANDFTNPVTYTVTAEDDTNTADWTVTVNAVGVTPISNEQLLNGITVYPNPANDIIEFKIAQPGLIGEALIIDLRGKVILQKTFRETGSFNISTLKPGIYLMLVKTYQQVNITKIEKR